MGTWAVPNRIVLVERLEQAMAAPLTELVLCRDLHDVVGDDTLWDMVGEAAEAVPDADVRPLVAAHIEMMTRWMLPSDFLQPWESGVRPRLEFIAERHAEDAMPRFLAQALQDDDMAAAHRLVEVIEPEEGVVPSFASKRIAPGVYAFQDNETKRLYRVECRYGLVHEAPEQLRDALADEIFTTVSPTFN